MVERLEKRDAPFWSSLRLAIEHLSVPSQKRDIRASQR